MSRRAFIEQYVLNAALGAGRHPLNVEGAVKEAVRAWAAIDRAEPPRPTSKDHHHE